jgi:hypothetical protein
MRVYISGLWVLVGVVWHVMFAFRVPCSLFLVFCSCECDWPWFVVMPASSLGFIFFFLPPTAYWDTGLEILRVLRPNRPVRERILLLSLRFVGSEGASMRSASFSFLHPTYPTCSSLLPVYCRSLAPEILRGENVPLGEIDGSPASASEPAWVRVTFPLLLYIPFGWRCSCRCR